MHLLFGFSGRTGRGGWWLGQFAGLALILAVGTLAGGIANLAGGPHEDLSRDRMEHAGLGVGLTVLGCVALLVWINLAVTVKRYHDRDKSGWWVLITIVPMIGPLWQIVECGFLPGSPGGNDYGHPPGLELDRWTGGTDEEEAPARRFVPAQPAPMVAPAATQTVAPRRSAAGTGFGRRGRAA